MHCVKETAFPQQLEPLLGKAEGGMGGRSSRGRGRMLLCWLRAASSDDFVLRSKRLCSSESPGGGALAEAAILRHACTWLRK